MPNSSVRNPKSLAFRKGHSILNINSLLLHKDELASILFEKGIRILALNETKLDKKMPRNLLDIKTYKLEKEDRNRHGGGVAVYIRDSMKYIRRDDVPINGLELVCTEIQPVKASPFPCDSTVHTSK